MGQTTPRPSVWCSKHIFFHNFLQNSTSGWWVVIPLIQQPSVLYWRLSDSWKLRQVYNLKNLVMSLTVPEQEKARKHCLASKVFVTILWFIGCFFKVDEYMNIWHSVQFSIKQRFVKFYLTSVDLMLYVFFKQNCSLGHYWCKNWYSFSYFDFSCGVFTR